MNAAIFLSLTFLYLFLVGIFYKVFAPLIDDPGDRAFGALCFPFFIPWFCGSFIHSFVTKPKKRLETIICPECLAKTKKGPFR